jgi:hypothetical protein
MKPLKLTIVILSSLAALVAITVVLAFNPAVQTWAVRRALSGQPGLVAEVGRVSVGLSAAELRDVRIVQDGVVVVAKEITAAYSATDYLTGRKITVNRVSARGIEVDARKPVAKTNPAPTPPPAPFAGILNAIRLPGVVRVGQINVEAKVLLPDEQTAQLAIEGGGIAPDETGSLRWKANFTDTRKGAALVTAQTSGEVKIRTTSDLRVDLVEIAADAGATGPGLPTDTLRANLSLKQAAAGAGETLLARVSLVRGTNVEPLLNSKIEFAAGRPVLDGVWDLAVRSEQFATVLASFGLPEVALSGKGSFTFNLETSASTAAGEITGAVSRLEKLNAGLADLGALQIRAAFEGGSGKDSAQLGRLEFDVATADGRKFVAIAAQQKLSFNFKDKRVTPEKPGTELARVSLLAMPLAWAQPWVTPRTITSGDLSAVFVIEAELDGSRVKVRALEPLSIRAATVREGDTLLVDRLGVSLSPSLDYTANRVLAEIENLGISTPDGDQVTGGLSADVTLGGTAPVIAFSAQLKGALSSLVKPFLPPGVGPLAFGLSAQGRHAGNTLELAALSLRVDRNGNELLAAIETLQPLNVDLAELQATASDAARAAARVQWGTLPLAWAEPYVPQSKLSGQLVAGAIEVTLSGVDTYAVRALETIALRGATVAMNGEEFIRGADFSTDLGATWKAGTATADIKRLELKQGTTSLLVASVSGEATPGKALRAKGRGQIDADFAALAKQPALAAHLPLLRGAVTVKFDASMADGVQAKLNILAKDLVAREASQALGTLDLAVEAALDANNAGSVRIPLTVTKSGRRSDLLIDGKVGLKPGAISFDGRITGDQLLVDDLQAFAALGAPPPAPTPTAAAAKPNAPVPAPRPTAPTSAPKLVGPVKDTAPVWAGFSGRIDLNVKSVKQGTGVTLADLRGALSATPERLTVENISGSLNGNPFKVATLLSFEVKQPRPYTLNGSLEVPGFDVGAFLRKADPNTPPPLETTFTVTSKFNGTAANVGEFADRLMGQFEFKGSKGILRALNRKAETTSAVTGLLGLAAGLAGQQGLAQGLVGASELAQLLKDMPFDGITIQVERGADAAIVVKSLEIISPLMRLTGNGRVSSKPGEPFENSPLSLQLQLAAKEQLANGLNRARQLNGNTDDRGYYLMATPFTLGGTVGKPDSSDFWKNLTLNTAGGFLR